MAALYLQNKNYNVPLPRGQYNTLSKPCHHCHHHHIVIIIIREMIREDDSCKIYTPGSENNLIG
jgi:hypothetical protein